jgi:hypothetical protein
MDVTRNLPLAGEFYRHFKGNLYQVIGTAYDATTMAPLVVYQALYGNYRWYVRTAEEFLSPVNKDPDSAVEYRFTKVNPGEEEKEVTMLRGGDLEVHEIRRNETVGVSLSKREEKITWSNPEEDQVRPELMRFLDAEKPKEKLLVLREIRGKIDEELMTSIELSIDLMPDEKESLERRLELVEKNLEKRVRYEGGRLR